MSRLPRLVLLTAALAAAPCSAAQAGTATATVTRDCAGDEGDPACYVAHDVRYVGAPGERNDVRVDVLAGVVVIRDAGAGAAPAAGAGCTQQAADTVHCVVQAVREAGRDVQFSVTADLGDGDDRGDVGHLEAPVDNVFVKGGAGADTLSGADVRPAGVSAQGGQGLWLDGGDGADTLAGGAASEILYGGAGRDAVQAGGGDDVLDGEGVVGAARAPLAEADALDGGDGRDEVSYGERWAPVTVDLADPGPDGEAGENDVLAGIEDVRGGNGANVLRGDDGPNRLSGSSVAGAADVLEGRGGDDELRGHGGRRDRLLGGAGDDRIDADAGTRACGDGADTLTDWPGGRPPADCERVVIAGVVRVDVRAVSIRGRRLVLRMRSEAVGRLRLTLSVRTLPSDRPVRRQVRLESGRTTRVTVRMPRGVGGDRRRAPRVSVRLAGATSFGSVVLRRPV